MSDLNWYRLGAEIAQGGAVAGIMMVTTASVGSGFLVGYHYGRIRHSTVVQLRAQSKVFVRRGVIGVGSCAIAVAAMSTYSVTHRKRRLATDDNIRSARGGIHN